MNRRPKLTHRFIESFPEKLEDDVVYVSIEYKTAAHNCMCGCGNEVNTPLSPAGWRLIFDGVSVSLYPSIGNWGFHCQSHYWIEQNQVKWAGRWTKDEIRAGRERDASTRDNYYGSTGPILSHDDAAKTVDKVQGVAPKPTFKQWLRKLVRLD